MTRIFKKTAAIICAVMLGGGVLSGCNSTTTDEETLSIVATVFPSYDFALQLTESFGLQCDVKLLLTPGGESHSYEPSPSDVAAIQSCDVFLYIGGASEVWVDYLLESTRKDKISVRLMDYVTPIATTHDHDDEEAHHDHAHDDADLAEYDEHIWTSPQNAIAMVNAIAAQISAASPENAEACAVNEKQLCDALNALDADYRALADTAADKPLVFGDRFPFLYLAEEYGFTYEAAFSGCTGDTDASAATLSALITTVKEQNINTVFYLENSSRKIADAISEATGAKTAMLHSCNNVTREEFESGKHFQTFMEENLAAMREALR